MNLPPIVSQEEWQAARERLLAKEKAATRLLDELNAERRRLPMVEIDKEYRFEGCDGLARLIDLFEGRRQLIVYHFMFGPAAQQGCDGCSMLVDNRATLPTSMPATLPWHWSLVPPFPGWSRSRGGWPGSSPGTPRSAATSIKTSE